MDAIRRFAGHVASVRFEDLPAAAVVATKTFILDSIGVGIAGSGDAWAARLREAAVTWGHGDEATVWGPGLRLPAPSAAVVNGFHTHCLEFDCVHEGAVVHPMATVLAAATAHAERPGTMSGRDFLVAVALGVDVAASLGLAARGAMQFFRPATAGAFGAVAAAGKLSRFDADTLVDAFGIVSGHVSGTLQPHIEASPLLGLQIGFNARGALTAVQSEPGTTGEFICRVDRAGEREEMTVLLEIRGAGDRAGLAGSYQELFKRRLGVEVRVEIVEPGALAPLTEIEKRQKPIRLMHGS